MNKQFNIISKKPISNKLKKLFNRIYEINLRFFKANPGKFRIVVCHTEQEFKKEAKYYYQKWGTATVLRNGDIVIKHPNIVTKWKKSDYPKIVNHEMCHVFWTKLYKITSPLWLNEGLACIIGKNFSGYDLKKLINKYEINSKILHYRYIKKKVTGHIPFYPIWQGFTNYIINKKGGHKLFLLMRKFSINPKKSNYNKIFNQIFNSEEKTLFKEFIKDVTY